MRRMVSNATTNALLQALSISRCAAVLVSTRAARTLVRRRNQSPSTQKFLGVAILGPPNSGKSMLLNRLAGEKVGAVVCVVCPAVGCVLTTLTACCLVGCARVDCGNLKKEAHDADRCFGNSYLAEHTTRFLRHTWLCATKVRSCTPRIVASKRLPFCSSITMSVCRAVRD